MRSPAIAALLVLSTCAVTAQARLLVGPGGFAEIASAIAMAVPGDEVLVQAGSYPAFQLAKGITIRAEIPHTVSVAPGLSPSYDIAAGQVARIVGIDFARQSAVGGVIVFEDCSWIESAPTLELQDCTTHIERCVVSGLPSPGAAEAVLLATNADISMADSAVTGAAATLALDTSRAVWLRGGARLAGSHVQLRGGSGPFVTPPTAIGSDATSRAYLADSTLVAYGGACAIEGTGVFCDRCTVQGGPCAAPNPTDLLSTVGSGALTPGQGWTVALTGVPNQLFAVIAAFDIDRARSFPTFGPLRLELASSQVFAFGLLDPAGTASATLQVPAAPLPFGVGVWMQGVTGVATPLRTSAVTGGIVRQ